MNNMRDRICRQCGMSFYGGPRAWYCPSCRTERARERNRNFVAAARPIGSTDKCAVCGKEYIVKAGRQKYCPECAPIEIKKVDRKQSLTYYHKNKDVINPLRNARRKAQRLDANITGAVFRKASDTKGVTWHKYHSAWLAYIYYHNKFYSLGYYDRKTPAIKARKEAEIAKKEGNFESFLKKQKERNRSRSSHKKDREYQKKYYQKNKEKIKARMSDYYKKNKEDVDKRSRKWKKENPEKYKELYDRVNKKYYKTHREEILKQKKEKNLRLKEQSDE